MYKDIKYIYIYISYKKKVAHIQNSIYIYVYKNILFLLLYLVFIYASEQNHKGNIVYIWIL